MRCVVLALALLAVASPAEARRRAPPPPIARVVHSADVQEKVRGPVRMRELLDERGRQGAAAMLLVSLPRDAKLQGALGPKQAALIYVLEGEVVSRAPADRRKRQAALEDRLQVHDALYARPPSRQGWELVGAAEVSRLVVLRVPYAGTPRRGKTFDPLVRSGAAAQEYDVGAGKGAVKILFDPAISKDRSAYVGRLRADHGMSIPEHVHAREAELLFIYSGFGEMGLGGKLQPVSAGDAVYIPPGVPHSFRVTSSEAVKAVQFYTPAGPEQRFKRAPLSRAADARAPP